MIGGERSPNNHNHMMIITLIYSWNVTGIFFIFLLVGAVVHRKNKNIIRTTDINNLEYQKLDYQHNIGPTNKGFLDSEEDEL